MKKGLIAVVVVFVLWSALDFVIHGVILGSAYAATSQIWRPMDQMKMGLMHVVTLVCAGVFVAIYVGFVSARGIGVGLKFGLLYGLGSGIAMGYGTYSVIPIPYYMALAWFLGAMVEAGLAGLVVGWLIEPCAGEAAATTS
jgi:hypothetical protein